jgi:hypothetical protein
MYLAFANTFRKDFGDLRALILLTLSPFLSLRVKRWMTVETTLRGKLTVTDCRRMLYSMAAGNDDLRLALRTRNLSR